MLKMITAMLPDRSGLISVFIKQQGQKLTLIIVFNTLTKHGAELTGDIWNKLENATPVKLNQATKMSSKLKMT